MNIQKSLKSLGFKKHKDIYLYSYKDNAMLPDIFNTEFKVINGVRTKVITKKEKPKSHHCFSYTFSNIEFWIYIKNDIIYSITIIDFTKDPKSDNSVKLLMNEPGRPSIFINSRNDLINLLPLSMKRDLVLSSLFR